MSDEPGDDKRRTACVVAMLGMISPREGVPAADSFARMLATLKDYDEAGRANMQRELEEARATICELFKWWDPETNELPAELGSAVRKARALVGASGDGDKVAASVAPDSEHGREFATLSPDGALLKARARIAALEEGQVNAAVEALLKETTRGLEAFSKHNDAIAVIRRHWLETRAKAPREAQ